VVSLRRAYRSGDRRVAVPDSGDFQDIPLWRKLVAEFAIGVSAEYGRTLGRSHPVTTKAPFRCWDGACDLGAAYRNRTGVRSGGRDA
jgi:hypothetical protein